MAAYTVKHSDPWHGELSLLKGTVGSDGVERVSTSFVFDQLALSAIERTPAAGKRVRAIMERLGWSALRQTSLTPAGSAARMRGYARKK